MELASHMPCRGTSVTTPAVGEASPGSLCGSWRCTLLRASPDLGQCCLPLPWSPIAGRDHVRVLLLQTSQAVAVRTAQRLQNRRRWKNCHGSRQSPGAPGKKRGCRVQLLWVIALPRRGGAASRRGLPNAFRRHVT